MNATKLYDDSVNLRTRQPNIKFTFAVLVFDFCPILTVDVLINTTRLLKNALSLAKKQQKYEVCLGSITRFSAEVISINSFVKHIQECIDQIKERVGGIEDLEGKAENDLIDISKLRGLKLFCCNI